MFKIIISIIKEEKKLMRYIDDGVVYKNEV